MNHVTTLSLVFWGTAMLFFLKAAPTYLPTNSERGFPFLLYQHLLFMFFWMIAILTGVRWYLTVVLTYIVLMTSNTEHHFMHLLATGIFSLKKCLFSSSTHFSIELFDFFMLSIWAYYILILVGHIIWKHLPFSKSSFCFVDGFLCCTKVFSLIRSC